jgi:hypothetical protein
VFIIEQDMLTLPGNLVLPSVFVGVRVDSAIIRLFCLTFMFVCYCWFGILLKLDTLYTSCYMKH